MPSGKQVGRHYNGIGAADYAWRLRQRRSAPKIAPKIASISSKLRNLG